MNNVYLGGIGSTNNKLKKDHYFNADDMNKYFKTPQIVKLLNDAQNWLNKGSYEQYVKKLNSLKYLNYLDRYEKSRDRIAIKLGIDPTTAKYYSNFGDYMS